MLRRTSDAGYCARAAARRRLPRPRRRHPRAHAGHLPTHDLAATPAQGRELAAAIPGARYVELDTSHISNWERPEEFNRAVLGFLLAQ